MGETAELLAKEFNISREEQDEFAALSHKKSLSGGKQSERRAVSFFYPALKW